MIPDSGGAGDGAAVWDLRGITAFSPMKCVFPCAPTNTRSRPLAALDGAPGGKGACIVNPESRE